MANKLFFYIFTPYKIEAVSDSLPDFASDDLVNAISLKETRIATTEKLANELRAAYPNYREYKVVTEEVIRCLKTVSSS